MCDLELRIGDQCCRAALECLSRSLAWSFRCRRLGAGEFRHGDAGDRPANEVLRSLHTVFDPFYQLGRENHLKGRSPEEWAHSACGYIYELENLKPFIAGNEVALCEFAEELALKNNLVLRWQRAAEIEPLLAAIFQRILTVAAVEPPTTRAEYHLPQAMLYSRGTKIVALSHLNQPCIRVL